MVLENLFLRRVFKKKYVFFLTVFYCIISIIIARLVFGSSSGIVSVAFVSFLLIPSLRKIFEYEQELEMRERVFSFINLWKDNKVVFQIYLLVFFGVFFSYLFFSFILPQFSIDVFNVFQEQLFLDPALRGKAFDTSTFWDILSNNWIVLVVCFLLGLIAGDGAIFFVIWNASAWGTLFGYRALYAATASGSEPWVFLFLLVSIVIWHTLIEGIAYILAAISGSTISKDVVSKKGQVNSFLIYFFVGGLFVFFLTNILRFSSVFLNILSSVIVFLTWTYFMKLLFNDKKREMVFVYNFWLLVVAIAIFVIGALVETFVLSNSASLQNIYSFLA